MNRLIILGNGFDLSHKFRTSYIHFISDHILKAVFYFIDIENLNLKTKYASKGSANWRDRKESSFFKLKKPINTDTNSWDKKFSEYYDSYLANDYDGEIILKFMENVILTNKNGNKNLSKISPFFAFLITQKKVNWCDIESNYFKLLTRIFLSQNKEDNILDQIIQLNKDFNSLKVDLIKYLENIEINTTITAYNKLFYSDVNAIYYKGTNRLFNTKVEEIIFLNFNYTNTIKNYLSETYKPKVINIHGTLSDKNSQLIFGYGDENTDIIKQMEEYDMDELLVNLKSPKYVRNDDYSKLMNFVVKEDFQVFIIGHSCGLSDRVLLREIFEHKNCKSIKIFHYKDYDEKSVRILRLFNDKTEMRKKVEEYDPDADLSKLV